ncbi:hypothetical protein FRC08_014416 [Ceratobasidium sp. 394]|nr:hypothetical protein FRC08_014416 [Ceratobasidium sp. 394]KAG9102115.1 hypothetical protein FS749_015698 [Ceratobasidium sp. UAMH 11750]
MSATVEPTEITNAPESEDKYCYICEDGGDMIECSTCPNACCYDVIGKKVSNPMDEPGACVTVPDSMANNREVPFVCPSCVSEKQPRSIGYFINRGARCTMRVAPRTCVALVVYHLKSHAADAQALADQLLSALQVFYINVAWQTRLLHHSIGSKEAEGLFAELPRDAPYHLAVVFLTESDPRGGWWHTSAYGSQRDSTVSEKQFLESCLHNLRHIARNAVTARLFGLSCGFNLHAPKTWPRIQRYLHGTPFLSMVSPSTCSLLLCEYASLLPDLFVHLYYFGAGLDAALMSVWGKASDARKHTGLFVMQRPQNSSEFDLKKILYSPPKSSPFGVQLPVAGSICGCPQDSRWDYKTQLENRIELVFVFQCSRCKVELQVGIYPGRRRSFVFHDATFTEEIWDRPSKTFLFAESGNVRMKILPAQPKSNPRPPDLSVLWTRAGINVHNSQNRLLLAGRGDAH